MYLTIWLVNLFTDGYFFNVVYNNIYIYNFIRSFALPVPKVSELTNYWLCSSFAKTQDSLNRTLKQWLCCHSYK